MSSFVEAVCCTFDDTGLSEVLDSGTKADDVSSEQVETLNRLSDLCCAIPDDLSEIEVINHLVMDNVRSLAAQLLEDFLSD